MWEKNELEKCRKDPVYFAEKYCGHKLTPWQKTYLRIIQKARETGKIFIKGRTL